MSYRNEVGLFLGLLSYPFDLDGKSFYDQQIVKFFEIYRKFLRKYDIDAPISIDDDELYVPKGYRLFGTQGLAILSLVDDYSFFTRVFNKNHIQTVLEKDNNNKKNIENDPFIKEFNFKSVVVSGVMETIPTETGGYITLKNKARKTFLAKEDKYTYIGIIRLKIDPRVLTRTQSNEGINDQGMAVTKRIREAIYNITAIKLKDERLDYICVDCFDNDEMTVMAFSNNLLYLYNFLGEIRSLKCTDIGQEYKNGNTVLKEKHVFASTLLCFGYDPDKIEAVETDNNLNGFYINCLIESKTGHRDSLFEYLKNKKKDLFENNLTTNITGGCNVIAKVPITKIRSLEKLCEKDLEFIYHTRKVKISLPDVSELDDRIINLTKYENIKKIGNEIDVDLDGLRRDIKSLGVSKALRDRTMALFELYDNAHRNPLQQFYLDELKGVLEDFPILIKELDGNPSESLLLIEKTLNKEIDNMESAIYDRLHHQKYNQAPLEYNGGIQQYLTAFDYAYKIITSALGMDEKVYVTITGTERASSVRNLFRLNINNIVYPELFAYAVWKEASNYTILPLKGDLFQEGPATINNSDRQLLHRWNMLLDDRHKDSRILDDIKYEINKDRRFNSSDPIQKYILDNVSNEMLSYFLQDAIVYHFTYLYDFELMWHTYLKTMLQTSICYYRLNKIDKGYLTYMLLRLFMVNRVMNEKDDDATEFINNQKDNPFDASLGAAWIECFQKTLDLSEIIYEVIEKEEFLKLRNIQIGYIENRINQQYQPIDNQVQRRQKSIENRKYMDKGEVILPEENDNPVNYLICLFNAYLGAVRDLDCPPDDKQYPIKSVPRLPKDGSILGFNELHLKEEVNNRMSNVLSDPTGGFFTRTAETRQKYFTYRTVLYRSLWNFRFMNINRI